MCEKYSMQEHTACRCSCHQMFTALCFPLFFVTQPTTGRESVSLDCDNIWSMSVRAKEHPSGALRRQITLACLGN